MKKDVVIFGVLSSDRYFGTDPKLVLGVILAYITVELVPPKFCVDMSKSCSLVY